MVGRWTSFKSHGSRTAGAGILMDDYSEESGNPVRTRWKYGGAALHTPEEMHELLNPPVIIIKKGRKKG